MLGWLTQNRVLQGAAGLGRAWSAAVPPLDAKASKAGAVIALHTAGRPVWTPRTYAALARAGYMKNPVVYRSVRMVAEAQRHQGQEKEVLDYYRNNPEALQSLQSPILEDKVVDFIVELASVTDRDATIEDLVEETKAKEAMDAEAAAESPPHKKTASKASEK